MKTNRNWQKISGWVLHAGGPGVGQLQLTVIGAFDGVPGDTTTGNGNYDLPPETVATGQISIR